MQVLALVRTLPSATPDQIAPLIKTEAAHVWALHLRGTLRAAHFLQAPGAPFPMGVSLMLETDDPAQAQALLGALPMVTQGLVSVEILPLAPFLSYAVLFTDTPVRA